MQDRQPINTLQHAIRHIREEYGKVIRCHDGRGDVIHYENPAHWDAFVLLEQCKAEIVAEGIARFVDAADKMHERRFTRHAR